MVVLLLGQNDSGGSPINNLLIWSRVEKAQGMSDFECGKALGGKRVAKVLARAGVCSRREAEHLITAGRVAVNGQILATPVTPRIMPTDVVSVDGTVVATAPAPTRLWRYYKPRGVVVTHRDPEGRQTVFATLPANLPRVVSVGRLDVASEGLLLLTNDGALARRLELPDSAWVRRYRVRIHGTVELARLTRLAQGIIIEGITYGPIRATLDCLQRSNAWLTVSLREGRNREIRHVMAAHGWLVSRLIRVAYGPFHLGGLVERVAEEISSKVLREQLGL